MLNHDSLKILFRICTQQHSNKIMFNKHTCCTKLKEVREHSHFSFFFFLINENKLKQMRKANLKSIKIIHVAEIRDPGHSEALKIGYVARLSMIQHDS